MLSTLRLVARSSLPRFSPITVSTLNRNYFYTMGDTSTQHTPLGSGTSTPLSVAEKRGQSQANKKQGNANDKLPKREVKILMLHGYTQSGALFRAKVRALEKILAKALLPLNLVPSLIYPTAPNRLSPRDIPGYAPSPDSPPEDSEIDSWAWFRRNEATGDYRLLREGMLSIASCIEEAGGEIEGVVGFSQGGCVAAMLAAALERDRKVTSGAHEEWVAKLREANRGGEVKFFVSYSGFWAVPQDLAWLYEPKIRTPSLHVLGGLDTVVEEGRSRGLVDRCEDGENRVVVVHPGGHYVPVSKEWVMPVAGFMRKYLEETKEEKKEEGEEGS